MYNTRNNQYCGRGVSKEEFIEIKIAILSGKYYVRTTPSTSLKSFHHHRVIHYDVPKELENMNTSILIAPSMVKRF